MLAGWMDGWVFGCLASDAQAVQDGAELPRTTFSSARSGKEEIPRGLTPEEERQQPQQQRVGEEGGGGGEKEEKEQQQKQK